MDQMIKIFENEEFGSMRTLEESGKVFFCGKDAATALGYRDTVNALKAHCKEDGVVIHHLIDSMGRKQAAKFISEGNLYRLISHSRLPSAEKFERWIFDEVLPTIRRTGGYVANEDMFIENYLPFLEEPYQGLFRLQMMARKYSGKYSLSELMICGCCGTPYRRKIWMKNGVKLAVWRCISRLEHGKKYCPDSPTIKEEQLHKAIIRTINNYYSCRDDIARILKTNIGTVLECQGQEEMISIENRLKEIDQARNDLVMLIASGGCDEDKLDSEFAKLYAEEKQLSERLDMLKSQNKTSAETQAKLDKIMDMIEHEKFELETFDNVLIRKLIECVKVLSKTEILVIFKGGYEVKTDIE